MDYENFFNVITPFALITLDGRTSGDRSEVSLIHDDDTASWNLVLSNAGVETVVNFAESLIPDGGRRIAVRCDGSTVDVFCDGVKIATTSTLTNLPDSFLLCRPGQLYSGGGVGNCNTEVGAVRISAPRTDTQLADHTTTLAVDADTYALLEMAGTLGVLAHYSAEYSTKAVVATGIESIHSTTVTVKTGVESIHSTKAAVSTETETVHSLKASVSTTIDEIIASTSVSISTDIEVIHSTIVGISSPLDNAIKIFTAESEEFHFTAGI